MRSVGRGAAGATGLRGIDAAQGPMPARAGTTGSIGSGKKCEQPNELHVLPSVHSWRVTPDGLLTDHSGHGVRRDQHVLDALLADQQWQCWERGVASGGGTVWRHGCRHRASRDGFTACPDAGCGAAPPTNHAHEIFRFSVQGPVYRGRLHAYRRGTRRKYVHVGSGAASMPLKVPPRYARRHYRFSSTADGKSGIRSGDHASGRGLCGRSSAANRRPPIHDLAQARLARPRAGTCPRPPRLARGPTGGP
ncbi:hypothetical protein LMG19144_03610 [Xanthomonas arboricola pv. fragariae]|nr:hypothetical protein LMG19144_03610 [Xanthomonas arboricola pv. fragariae]